MRVLVLVLVLLAATAAVLFGPGLFRGGNGGVDAPTGPGAVPPGTGPELAAPPSTGPVGTDLPVEEPEPELLRLERPLKVLVLVNRMAQRWARTMDMAVRNDSDIIVSAYALESVPGTPPFGSGPVPPDGKPPTAAWFDAQAFDVVALCELDPSRLEPALWASIAGRVRAGSLGLWAQPGIPQPPSGGGPTPDTHPLLLEPSLAPLLPVARATPVRGQPVPGVFTSVAPFQLSAAGEKHPASRIVFWPEWSRRVWQLGASGTPPWGTQFCYPVEALREGSVVLVDVHPERGPVLPMYVQGPPSLGRVLWFGALQLDDGTLRDGRQSRKWYALIHNALVWLAGRAP